ncbi:MULTISPECIES: potassium channel family protein [Rhodopirellula]|uniref:Ion transport 2 domain protein n=2 Tax=Rhodopirellula TaxID=265488 RepID=M5RZJ5_9BACT|nr:MULTISPECIES: potassium channel family protein [Rhodopirellula]EMI24730.1 Ion transport 2 domain protein [Rhodopirellula europaea SH398]PHQ34987.1 transporter [Rhodopirellula bahusiensis]
MNMWLLTILGTIIVALSILETFMAVLHPRAVTGPVTSFVNRMFHKLLKTSIGQSSYVTLLSGPVLIVTQVICWASLLLLAFSLIVWPQLGSGIVASSGKPTDTTIWAAIYYAGFTVTTLGVGDLVPKTAAMQLLTILAAGLGFSFFTLVLAYVISIYSTLSRRNQFANEIDYRTAQTGDSLRYLVPYLSSDEMPLLNQDLYTLSANMAELLESHHFYPSLHYFRFAEDRYAMSRVLRFCLEVASLIKAMQETGGPAANAVTEPADRLWHASLQMLRDTEKHFVVCKSQEPPEEVGTANRLISQMAQADTSQRVSNENAFLDRYAQLANTWSTDLHSLVLCMGSQIDGRLDDQHPNRHRNHDAVFDDSH